MSKNSKELSKLKNEIKKNWKNKLIDVFLFGSSVKGKNTPNDVDICLVFRENIDLDLVKRTSTILGDKYHVSSLIADNFFTKPHSLSKTMLLEGHSIISNRRMADIFSLKSNLLY